MGARGEVRKLIDLGRSQEAEKDPQRLQGYYNRKNRRIAPAGAEAIIGSTSDFQTSSFLTEGARVRRAVAYVEVNDIRGSTVGTGFLVSPDLFLTNQHVIADAEAAKGAVITFDREMDESGRARSTTTYLLDPGRFALFSEETELDYALIAIGAKNSGSESLADFGYCILSDSPDRHRIGMSVNIIQHPRGWPKMIAIRNNLLTFRTERTLLYETDTDQGASGSPVFNDDWDVIALHHWGGAFLEKQDESGNPLPRNVNEGVRISRIYGHLEGISDSLPADRKGLLREALSFSKRQDGGFSGRTLSGPRNARGAESTLPPIQKGLGMSQQSGNQEMRLNGPIEIIIRVGAQEPATRSAGAPAAPVPPKSLSKAAEALRLDRVYANRLGYRDDFIRDHVLPLPKPNKTLAGQIAPLKQEEDDFAQGVLKYEHFSVVMNKAKRMAMFTATNILGSEYLEVNRKTGRVSNPEGETWYKDPRISASFYLDQSFYSDWSTYFDRGHLTRRTDPTWGKTAEAERANADTFHFTNCTPQHFRFNQTAEFWQGVERYVLENGALKDDDRKPIAVFQGPIFDEDIDRWADDVQIPSSFFKVVVWMGKTRLKAVGLVVDQLPLLDENRRNLGQPREIPEVDVSQWRVRIQDIEKRTGLDFGDDIRNADTISKAEQPVIGGEAIQRIHAFTEIVL